jgi:phage-related protein
VNLISYKYKRKEGTKFAVEYAKLANGSLPAKEFIDGLAALERTRIDALIKRFHETGVIQNREQMKNLKGNQFFEFKRFKTRILGYYPSQRRGSIVLTNGFVKKSDGTPKNQIDRAERIREEYERLLNNAPRDQKRR